MEPFKVFPLYDVNIVRGNATRIYDDQGKEYLASDLIIRR